MKKETQAPKTVKKSTKEDIKMDGPFSEKDEVKRAEDKMRKSAGKTGK